MPALHRNQSVGARFIAPCLFSRGGAEKTGGWRCCAAYLPYGCRFCSALAGLDDGAVCLRRFRARYAHAPPTVTHVARLRRCLGCERKACHRGHDETLVWIPMPLKGRASSPLSRLRERGSFLRASAPPPLRVRPLVTSSRMALRLSGLRDCASPRLRVSAPPRLRVRPLVTSSRMALRLSGLRVSASPRLRVSASPRLRVSASPRLRVRPLVTSSRMALRLSGLRDCAPPRLRVRPLVTSSRMALRLSGLRDCASPPLRVRPLVTSSRMALRLSGLRAMP